MNTSFVEMNSNELYDVNGGIGLGTVIVVGAIIFVAAAIIVACVLS